MKAALLCIPCFLNQAVEALELAGANEETSNRTMKRLLSYLKNADLTLSPPELSLHLHSIIREETGNPDPYIEVKKQSTETVRFLLPGLEDLMRTSEEKLDGKPLELAIKIGALGNVIDFGTPTRMDVNEMIHEVLEKDLTVFDIDQFRKELERAGTILFLGDNTGEIILDRFLLGILKEQGKEIIYAVREGPIINDATIDDAQEAGIEEFARVITSGSQGPGTLLGQANEPFLEALANADLIISKGQGNYESLSSDPELSSLIKPGTSVFFLLTIKCRIVGAYAGVPERSTIFKVLHP